MEARAGVWQLHKRLFVAALILLLAILCTSLVIVKVKTSSVAAENPFSAAVRKSAQTTLYYPRRLPHGYSISKTGVSQPQKGVTILVLYHSSGRKIYISEEVLPSNFNLQLFYKNFRSTSDFSTAAGRVKAGLVQDSSQKRAIVSIVTYDSHPTWILLDGSADVQLNTLISIAKDLQPAS